MTRLSRYPFHFVLFAIYPVLALLAFNIHEVPVSVIWRPLVITLAGSIITSGILRWLLRDWQKAAILTTSPLILFFCYGRLYDYLKSTPLNDLNIVRHRWLVILFVIISALITWLVIKRIRDMRPMTAILNLIAILLVSMAVIQIGIYEIKASSGSNAAVNDPSTLMPPATTDRENLPDVYYIVLDGYTRSDVLKTELAYDNSGFLDQLTELGFYVASCSRSNYNKTQSSMASSLNMDYLPELYKIAAAQGLSEKDIWMLIKPSLVRRNFENLGYLTVAFNTGYKWTSIDDADLYLSRGRYAYGVQFISPFEQMLMDSSLLAIYSDFKRQGSWDAYNDSIHPKANYIGLQEYILYQLPRVAELAEPTFTYAHINITHEPYVFSPDGYLLDANETAFPQGYLHAIDFINTEILTIIKQILAASDPPPIIIIQADHGYWVDDGTPDGFNIPPILNAYYLPGVHPGALYPTISPVNTFRLVFNEYFNGHYQLLPDTSYRFTDIENPLPEVYPDCQK
ncbi:MAG: hypothetical protein JW704_08130 [Anaerolineaceae bacterium]|nr:hypothetical protein [Anaerolineaceae bacterium]